MPSSRPESIPPVVSLVRQIRPASILDIGVGFGKWGLLFREYTDILSSEAEPSRYGRSGWRVKIDGIEGFPGYLTPIHDYVYNALYIGDARDVLVKLGCYDITFMGDVIEHFSEVDGAAFIEDALRHTAKYLIVTSPAHETQQSVLCGNALEIHRSLWTAASFRRLGATGVYHLPGDILLAVFAKPGIPRIRPRASRTRPSLVRSAAGCLVRRICGALATMGKRCALCLSQMRG